MPAGLIAGGIANAVGGLISGIIAISQKKQGKKILGQIGEEVIPQDVLQNQSMARTMSNQGLPSEQYNQAMKNIQRQQLTALRGAQDRRGGLDAISSIQQGTNDAYGNLAVADSQQKIANQRQLMNVNNQIGDWKNRIWERKYNYGQSLVGAGNQNLVGGIDKILGGGALIGYGASGNGNFGGSSNPTVYGGSGMGAIPYGASVYNKLTTPRTPLTNRNVLIGG